MSDDSQQAGDNFPPHQPAVRVAATGAREHNKQQAT